MRLRALSAAPVRLRPAGGATTGNR
jgi:hypothetical protein